MESRSLDVSSPAAVSLSHLVLRTAHIDECVDFYGHLLGMKVNHRVAGGGAALSHDGEHHRIALMAVPPGEAGPRHAPGLEHYAWKTVSLGALLANYRRCKAVGIEPFMAIHHGGTLSAYYRDPDGVQVEVFIDTQVADLAIETMNSPAFATNPIGVPVDLEDLSSRYEAGESISALLAQPELKEGDLERVMAKLFAPAGTAAS